MEQWTPKMLISLKEDYLNFLPKEEMELKYKRNWESIRVKANKLRYIRGNPKNNKKYNLVLTKAEIINLYQLGNTTIDIAKICKCSNVNVSRILKSEDIKTRDSSHAKRTYLINENFFDTVDTEEKSYILGLFYADGYNNEEKNYSTISLQERDVQILEDINSCLLSNKPLRFISRNIGQNVYSLNIENKRISQKLAELGCVQAKSLILQFPTEKQVPFHLHNHFIRGYFDGDGSISNSNKYKNNCTFSLEGNEDFLIKVQKILMKECFLNKTKFYQKHKDRKSSVSLKYSGKTQISRIFEYLYKDATMYLKRKNLKFKQIL